MHFCSLFYFSLFKDPNAVINLRTILLIHWAVVHTFYDITHNEPENVIIFFLYFAWIWSSFYNRNKFSRESVEPVWWWRVLCRRIAYCVSLELYSTLIKAYQLSDSQEIRRKDVIIHLFSESAVSQVCRQYRVSISYQ